MAGVSGEKGEFSKNSSHPPPKAIMLTEVALKLFQDKPETQGKSRAGASRSIMKSLWNQP